MLSEKPMVDNQRQLDEVFKKAEEKQVFVMEGMWTRCFPAVIEARNWIEKGRIGKPLAVHASFDIKPDIDDWQPWKGGVQHAAGALRDVGNLLACDGISCIPGGTGSGLFHNEV